MSNKSTCHPTCLLLAPGGEMNGENYDIILIFISDINNHNYDGQNNYSKNHPSPGNSNNHLSENGQAKNLEGEIAYFKNRLQSRNLTI